MDVVTLSNLVNNNSQTDRNARELRELCSQMWYTIQALQVRIENLEEELDIQPAFDILKP